MKHSCIVNLFNLLKRSPQNTFIMTSLLAVDNFAVLSCVYLLIAHLQPKCAGCMI